MSDSDDSTTLEAGTDLESIREDWGREFIDLDGADDWKLLGEEFDRASRWCTHWRKIVRHESGLTIAILYAVDVGDGESADAFPVTWEEVREVRVEKMEWVRVSEEA